MKHTADAAGKGLELRERVVKRCALMDDAIQTGLGGNFKLLLENLRLPPFVTRVVLGAAAC